jgi:hypothetical protein
MLVEDTIHKSQFDESLRLLAAGYSDLRFPSTIGLGFGRGDGVSFILPLLIFNLWIINFYKCLSIVKCLILFLKRFKTNKHSDKDPGLPTWIFKPKVLKPFSKRL